MKPFSRGNHSCDRMGARQKTAMPAAIMIRRAAFAAFMTICCGLVPASAQGTASFDRLAAWTALLSEDVEKLAPAFFYVAPVNGFMERPISERDLYARYIMAGHTGVTATPLWTPHTQPDIRSLTGLDFSGAKAFMATGRGNRNGSADRHEIFAIAIPGAETKAFRSAYEARDFHLDEIAGAPVFHRGEDNTINSSLSHHRRDPFAAVAGRSQRVALVGDTVLFAPAWEPLRSTIAALTGAAECTRCLPWQAMVAALDAATPDTHLEQAWGWPAHPTFRTKDLAAIDPDATSLPEFTQAIFAITARGQQFSPHLAVHFSDLDDAKTAAAEIARRFSSAIGLAQHVESMAIFPADGTNGGVAILTIRTGGNVQDAYGAVANWLSRGVFHPLAFE